jgi:hypothetical protein
MHNLRRTSLSADVLVAGTGVGHVRIDSRWFNKLSDHFALGCPLPAVSFEDLFGWRWPHPRHNERVLYHAPIQALARARAAVRPSPRLRRLARTVVGDMSQRAFALFQWQVGDSRRGYLEGVLRRTLAENGFRVRAYTRLFRRLRPRVILKEEACYGQAATFNRAAHEANIPVAEFQHGMVSSGHDAYNYAPSLVATDAFRNILPGFFLGYGRWWNEQIGVPLRKLELGNPYRTEYLARLPHGRAAEKTVLVLGDGIETARIVAFARTLSARLGSSYRVTFRPHPHERDAVFSGRIGMPSGVALDRELDIYRTFMRTRSVVGDASTALFEAIGIVPQILVWASARSAFFLPRHPFGTFQDVDGAVQEIEHQRGGVLSPSEIEAIWCPDWRARYERFLDDAIAGRRPPEGRFT